MEYDIMSSFYETKYLIVEFQFNRFKEKYLKLLIHPFA